MADTPSGTPTTMATRRVTPQRHRLFRHPGRVAVVLVSLLVVLNLGIVLLLSSDTSPGGGELPAAVQSVSPTPGSIAGPIDTITVDLDDSLTGVLLIRQNGRYVEIPEDQLDRVVELGQISFRPGPGKDITRFAPGETDALVFYWLKTHARPKHPASYAWNFQVKA
jgi:hypothetical protein